MSGILYINKYKLGGDPSNLNLLRGEEVGIFITFRLCLLCERKSFSRFRVGVSLTDY